MARIYDLELSSNPYSEELYPGLPTEADFDEVMAAPAGDEWAGYGDWSASLEQSEFERELERRATRATSRGPMLIKAECAHKDCGFTCKRKTRIDGIDI
jgi:hypothetical protein